MKSQTPDQRLKQHERSISIVWNPTNLRITSSVFFCWLLFLSRNVLETFELSLTLSNFLFSESNLEFKLRLRREIRSLWELAVAIFQSVISSKDSPKMKPIKLKEEMSSQDSRTRKHCSTLLVPTPLRRHSLWSLTSLKIQREMPQLRN